MKQLSRISITEAVRRLTLGECVVIPTETVYGLSANAFDSNACQQIFALKSRPLYNPLICHLPSADAIYEMCTSLPQEALALTRRFWPGPLTLILKKNERIGDVITGGLPTVGVRVPAHPVTLELLRTTGFPLAAPSANRFKRISATTVEAAYEELGDKVSYLDGGTCTVGLESTILEWTETGWRCLRVGGLALDKIEAVVGPVARVTEGSAVRAPGMLAQHYSPETTLELTDDPIPAQGTGLLILRSSEILRGSFTAVEELSATGDLDEAATNLFSALRRLDKLGLKKIVAVRVPDRGIGTAINDRLKRAAAQNNS